MNRTVELSESARQAAIALGKQMATTDNWIEPIKDVHVDEPSSYGDFQKAHREAWQQTLQWQMLWLEPLCDITEADASSQGVEKAQDWESWFYGFQEPAKEALWEAWEEARSLEQFWRDNVCKKPS